MICNFIDIPYVYKFYLIIFVLLIQRLKPLSHSLPSVSPPSNLILYLQTFHIQIPRGDWWCVNFLLLFLPPALLVNMVK